MTSIGPAEVVLQPQLVPPSISLLTAVTVVDETGDRWVNGIKYVPEDCDAGEIFELCDNDPTTGFEKTIAARGTAVTGTPYGAVVSDTCTTFSYKVADFQGRAMRKLLAMESSLVANELWTNSLGLNVPIAGAPNTTTIGTSVKLQLAIAYAEQAFIDCAPAVRPYIHLRPYLLEAMLGFETKAIRREGNRWYTGMDSVVVPDMGYPGTGPTGQAVSATEEWLYVTGPVQVRHGPVSIIPTNLNEAVLRTQNQVTFYAERAVHASFNPNCCTIALNVKRTE
jgi:hypothetical protein